MSTAVIVPTTDQQKQPGLRPAVDPAVRAEVIRLLKEQPEASDVDIAKSTGVSSTFVLKIRRKLTGHSVETIEEYGRQIAKRLPMSKRVSIWQDLVEGKIKGHDAHAVRAALIRTEELIGHVTAKEKRDTEDKGAPNLPALFQLPAGSQVKVAVAITVPDARSANKDSVNLHSEVIDVKADPTPGEGRGTP